MVKVGDRIRLIHMRDDPSWNKLLFSGDEGIVIDVSTIKLFNETQVWVQFDKGIYLALLQGIDRFAVI